jgi:hypothetical protein
MKEKKDLIKLPPVNLRAKGLKLPARGTLLAKSFDGKRLPDQLRVVGRIVRLPEGILVEEWSTTRLEAETPAESQRVHR